jgi:uncharacterized glyoxalase superfamily protein PhnB
MAHDVIPTLRYRDAAAAIDWLERAFGFERGMVVPGPDGRIAHAELRQGRGMVMLGSVTEDSPWPQPPGGAGVYVVVDDPDAHHAGAVRAGAEIVMGLTDRDYGSREYSARDPEGNLWCFGLRSPANGSAQIVLDTVDDPPPRFGIDLGRPEAVDAAYAEVQRRGLRIVYPLSDEPWGIRRFFVEDPGGTVVSVLAHLDPSAA